MLEFKVDDVNLIDIDWKSPIRLNFEKAGRAAAKAFDDMVFGAVAEVGIEVDRDELIKALAYDRGQYRQEILDGILDFEIEKGKWAYTYHSRMAEQLPFIIEELKRNPYSRRAVIDIRDWKYDSQTDSPACLQHIQFFIRDGELDMSVLFRSNDAVKATFMNAFALICLQEKIAGELGVEVGTYTHRVNSFHAYMNDWDLLKRYAEDIEEKPDEELTYDYKGEWQEYMDEFKPEIAAMVEELRGRD